MALRLWGHTFLDNGAQHRRIKLRKSKVRKNMERLDMKKTFLALLFWVLIPICGYAATADEYYHAGYTDYQAGKWGEAISYFEGAVQLNPNHWQAYQLLAYSYYRTNDIQKCIQNGDACLKINPNNPTLQNFIDKLKAQNLPAPLI
jgi:tetratricopeptide (TPR) repeat protein